jgi:RNA polymerase sigma-70 factor (ECF subfamily)
VYNEKELEKGMQALKNGDDSGFNVIYDQTHRLVYYVIFSILKDSYISEDIMQNTYIKIYQNIKSYQSNAPKAWITTIARNLAINEYNRKKHEQMVDIDEFGYIPDGTSERKDTPIIDLASKNLEDDEFMIVMLCVVEGYKRREVAKLTNLSTSGVTWKLNNALEKLRKLVEEENDEKI